MTQTSLTAETKKTEILSAAAELFDREGYHATTVEDIAAAVDLRKPSLYHYFKSKEEILVGIHQVVADVLIERIQLRIQDGVHPRDNLLEVVNDIIEATETHPGYMRVFLATHRMVNEEDLRAARARRDEYFQLVEGVIAAGVDSGVFKPVNTAVATLIIFGVCNSAEFRTMPPYGWEAHLPETGGRPRDIALMLWRFIGRGIEA